MYHRLQLAAHRARVLADRSIGAETGLTTAQASVLSVLSQEEASSQRAIADALGLRDAAITPMVARLLRMGLVSRTRDKSDGRLWLISLTDDGRSTSAKTKAPFAEVNRICDEALTTEEIACLAHLLTRLLTALEQS